MAGHYRFIAFAVAVGLGTFAMGTTVTEHFDSNTDGSWTGFQNTVGGQNYHWSATDDTGTAVNPGSPSVGSASGAGEMGGTVFGAPIGIANSNFYAFNVGTVFPGATALDASGVYHLTSTNNGSGVLLGFFKDQSSYNQPDPIHHNDNPANFIGLVFNPASTPFGKIYDAGSPGNEDRTAAFATVPAGTTVPFTFHWDPQPAGTSGKGLLTVSINGVTLSCSETGDPFNPLTDDFHYFGMMSRALGGNTSVVYFDDLTFTSNNPIPEPASLGLLSLGGLVLMRRRRRAA